MPTHSEFVLTGPQHGRPFAADATYEPTGRPKPIIVFVHGFKGFKDWGHFPRLPGFFAGRGFVFVKLNLSHNGIVVGGSGDLEDLEAFGRNNFSLELDDLGQLLDALHTPGATPVPPAELDLSRLFLVGHSRGGGLVLLKAAEDHRVRAVATWAALSDLDQRWSAELMAEWQRTGTIHIPNSRTGQQMPLHYQLVEDYMKNQPRLDIAENVRTRLSQPLLVLHGDQDETVPVRHAHTLKELKPDAELVIMPGATHMFGGAHPWPHPSLPGPAQELVERTAAFLESVA